MVGSGLREEGSRAESDKVPTSRLLDGGRTGEETSGNSGTSERGEREWPKEETWGWDDDTSSVVDGCAEPSVDGMASRESGVIAWRHRFRRRRARLASSSRPKLLWPWVTSPVNEVSACFHTTANLGLMLATPLLDLAV